ncbi:MAG: Asp-tRNA(Asn)/Glu-tRNA(Gln) amidotransferase subunit GatC [Candidatus Adiutrix sp.]
MTIDLKTIEKTMALARLSLGPSQKDQLGQQNLENLAQELSNIIAHIDVLKQANTEGIEPLYSPLTAPPAPRADEVINHSSNQELADNILGQAPDRVGRLFAVPKIM